MGAARLLEVRDLVVELEAPAGPRRVVDGLSLELDRGEQLGLVGSSGAGKSMAALAVLGLLPEGARVVRGSVRLRGQELLALPPEALRRLRGRELAMVFQEPASALNPVLRVGRQVAEALTAHDPAVGRDAARRRALELLERVGIPDPRAALRAYPHQLSGGMQQRALLAMALICDPALLLADEPTTALDLTVQAQVLDLLARIQRERQLAVLLITHDLSVVAERCQRVVVMADGRAVEQGDPRRLFESPEHPCTERLIAAARALALG